MNLDELYSRISETISSLDFGRIWPGFQPLKFALYDDGKCFYDGAYIEKSDDFCANTSINFQGEQIAIWKVVDDLPILVLASKIVHEMFHGYQTVENWNCWADEMEALYRYQYNADNLSLNCGKTNFCCAYSITLMKRPIRSCCPTESGAVNSTHTNTPTKAR